MSKSTCCSICLCMNKRTINIYETDLQYAYENLANFKISDDECWMCFICHTRLRQCHRLQQLAVQTRGLIDDIFQKKVDIKFEAFGSLLQLSTSKTKITDRTYNSSCIKKESDEQAKDDNGSNPDGITENRNHFEVEVSGIPMSDESEDPLDDITPATSNTCVDLQEAKVHEVKIVKRSQSDDDEYLPEDREGETWGGTGSVEIKLELEDIGGMEQNDQQNTNNSEVQDYPSEAQTDCQKKVSCKICFKKFKCKSDLQRHVTVHTNVKPFTCDICFRSFKTEHCLYKHRQVHSNHLPYSCQICPKKFLFESDYHRHVSSHRSDELDRGVYTDKDNTGDPNVCHFCSKKFSSKGSLSRHIRIHTGERPFVCHVCAKDFIEKCALDNHVLTHTGVKRFSCEICSKKFTLKLSLQKHARTHGVETKPMRCEICFREFQFKRNLNNHMRSHRNGTFKQEGKKTFSCNICTEQFSNERFFNSHIRVHSSDKVYSCDVCSKKFLRKRNLDRHKHTHSGDKPYSCDICSQKFTEKSSLRVHQMSHTGVRKFTCHICSKKFLRNSTLQIHIKTHRKHTSTETLVPLVQTENKTPAQTENKK